MPTALVTGGTSGIGAAFAEALAVRGFDLILVARDRDRLDSCALSLGRRFGVGVDTLAADLADPADVAVVAARLEGLGTPSEPPVDVLVNNAGFSVGESLISADASKHDAGFAVMCRAVLVLAAAAARSMSARSQAATGTGGDAYTPPAGTIINISSVAGFVRMGAYSSIKTWVTAYTESLAVELRGTGINVTAVCPGWVRTEFHERAGIRGSSIPGFMWLDAARIADEGLRDAARGTVISIPSKRFKVVVALVQHLPRSTVRWGSGKVSSRRKAEGPHPAAQRSRESAGSDEDSDV